MDGRIDLITLIALIVAVVAILKLRSVLGRRSDDDETRIERYQQAERQREEMATVSEGVAKVPENQYGDHHHTDDPETLAAEAEQRIKRFAGSNSEVEQGLLEILKLDRAFDPEHFIGGARQAYEMIVTAFAEGNQRLLKDLLSDDVYQGFASAIRDREAKNEQVDQSFVGINKANILEADVKSGAANITVRFESELISATRDADANVIAGDPQKIKEVTDIWTFQRDLSTARGRSDPNWKLIGTKSAH